MAYRDASPTDRDPIALARTVQRFDLAGQLVSPFVAQDDERWSIHATPRGLHVSPKVPNRTYNWQFDLPLPDAAFAVVVTVEGTPSAGVSLRMRCVDVGSKFLSYALHVRPSLQQYRLELVLSFGEESEQLIAWTRCEELNPVGRNELELRLKGDLLLPVINGRPQPPVRDATLGRGYPRLACVSSNPGDRFLIEWVRVATVE